MRKFLFLVLFPAFAFSQTTRVTEYNNIGWFTAISQFTVSNHFAINAEYFWRRADYGQNWQQSVLRIGGSYKITPELTARAGYVWGKVFNYGDIPITRFGKPINEHRAFEALLINTKIASFELTHRVMLEQRWVGRFKSADSNSEDSFILLNRLRYLMRWQLPLTKKANAPYAAVADEIMIGFGNNIGENVFDQNRFMVLLGYPINKEIKIEGGYVNQILQLGREINGDNVFLHNNGFILSGIFNFDLRKKAVQ